MTNYEAERRLCLFGIPARSAEPEKVREILARILAEGSLSLSDLQTARDVVEHDGLKTPESYLFLAAMELALRAGNTYLRFDRGPELLKQAGCADGQIEPAFGAAVDECWAHGAETVGAALAKGDGQLVVCKDVGTGEKGWFFAKVWNSVCVVSERLRALANKEDLLGLTDEAVQRAVLFKGKGGPFALNGEQQQAVKTVARRRFTVVTGGPGTGKTTVVCAILRALLERGDVAGEDIVLVAPTGRAAQRMSESIHAQCAAAVELEPEIARQIEALSGATIHTTLGGFPPKWKYTAENRLPYKLVIVDECSMVDVHLMRALLEALPDECRLVLLGDEDQLPSVDVGAVLGSVVSGFGGRTVVRLEKSNRFTGVLADCAKAINTGDKELFERSIKDLPVGGERWTDTLSQEGDNVNRVFRYRLKESAKPADCQRLVLEWVRNYGLLHTPEDKSAGKPKVVGALIAAAKSVRTDNAVFTDGRKTQEIEELFGLLERSRILTVVREGPLGANGINELVVTARFGGRRPANPLVKVGVPVIVTRNTRERNLWNGDIGVTVKGPDGMTVLFPRGDKVVVCPVGLLPEHALAYAMTVHKSQGSEFENVLVILPNDANHPLLNRQIVYTGITRAKKRAVLLGTETSIDQALARKLVRDTGLAVGN